MQVYKDITPPTAVSHCLSASLISPDTHNLVVVKGSCLLQIFTFVAHESQSDSALNGNNENDIQHDDTTQHQQQDQTDDHFLSDIGLEQSLTTHRTKLVLVAEYQLHGFVTGIARVRTAADLRLDYMLLSFASAKLSLLSWDHARNCISTVSLHYYEKPSGILNATMNTDIAEQSPILRTDPGNYCACFKFGYDMFAFLPFKRDDDDDELFNGNSNTPTSSVFYSSFVVPATMLDDGIAHVIDAVFLHEYREPTLAILYESKRTSTGLIYQQKDTVSLVVVALDLQQRASTSILSIANLPYDIVSVTALPAPIGGALLLGANTIVHVDASGRAVALAVNSAAKITSLIEFIDQSGLQLKLEGSKAKYLQDNIVLLILGSGELYLLQFTLEGRAVESISLHKSSEEKLVGGAASCIATFSKRVFIGCPAADGVLLSWRKSGIDSVSLNAASDNGNSELVKSKEYDDDDEDLYGESSTTAAATDADESTLSDAQHFRNFTFAVHDRLTNYGPLIDLAIGAVEIRGNVASNIEVTSRLEVVGARAGEAGSAGLSIFRRSLTPRVAARFAFPDCKALFTVKTKSRDTLTSGVGSAIADQVDKYMIISRGTSSGEDESVVYDISEQFNEVRGSEFDTRGSTLAAGSILDGTRIVQLCATEIRVYDSELKIVQMLPVWEDDGNSMDREPECVAASFSQSAVLVLLDNGAASLLAGSEETLELAESSKFPTDIVC